MCPTRRLFRASLIAVVTPALSIGVLACQKRENVAAQERLATPEAPDPLIAQAAEVLLASNLVDDDKLRDRVNYMTFAEMTKRLGSLKLETEGELSFERSDLKVRSKETVTLLQAPEGDFEVTTVTADGSTQQIVFTNGILFLKNNNGRWRASRDPVGERTELREEGAGIWRSFYELFDHALVFEPRGETTYKGRSGVRYGLRVAEEEAAALAAARAEAEVPRLPNDDAAGADDTDAGPTATPEEVQRWVSNRLTTWRNKTKPGGGKGELIVDRESGVILSVRFEGRLLVVDSKRPAELKVSLRHEVSDIGRPLEVVVPKDAIDEVVRKKWPVKPREILEKDGIVAPLPKEETAAAAGGTP
ncbi:MAG: hypothetical protein ACO3JL_09090 [Myxococcota bacterium]